MHTSVLHCCHCLPLFPPIPGQSLRSWECLSSVIHFGVDEEMLNRRKLWPMESKVVNIISQFLFENNESEDGEEKRFLLMIYLLRLFILMTDLAMKWPTGKSGSWETIFVNCLCDMRMHRHVSWGNDILESTRRCMLLESRLGFHVSVESWL